MTASEYWNCTKRGCKSKFIRRSYLSRHLALKHGYSQAEAREAAIFASRGDIPKPDGMYEDVSDDDSIFDLIAEREVADVHDFYEKIDDFNDNLFNQSTLEDADETDILLDGDVDIEILESVVDGNMSDSYHSQVPRDIDNAQNGDDNVSGNSVNMETMNEHDRNESVDGIRDVNDDDVIIISSDSDDDNIAATSGTSDDRTVEVSHSRTVIQTFVLTFHRKLRYVNGSLVETSTTMDRDYYQYTE